MAAQNRFGKGLFGWVLFIALAVGLFMLLSKSQNNYPAIPLGDFNRLLHAGEVRSVDIGKDSLSGEFKRDEAVGNRTTQQFRVSLPEGTTSNWAFTDWLLRNAGDANIGVASDGGQNLLVNIIVPLIPWLLIFGFIWFFVFRQLRVKNAAAGVPLKVFVVNQPGAAEATPSPSETQT